MLPDVAVDENGQQGENRAYQHTDLHAKLSGGGLPCGGKLGDLGAGNGSIRDDTDELRTKGGAQIAAGGHHGKDKYAAGGETLRGHHQIAGPQHGGAEAGEGAGQKSDNGEGAECTDQIAKCGADGTKSQHFADVFAALGVQGAACSQREGKQGNTEDVAPDLGDAQSLLQVAGAPLGHDHFRAAAQENGSDADPEPLVAEILHSTADLTGGFHFWKPGADEQNSGG